MNSYLSSVHKQFTYYKSLGDKTFDQIADENLFWQFNPQSNSIATIIEHISGNMLSRWTDFLTTDGEKEWRNRDEEFLCNFKSNTELLAIWEKGWTCLFNAIEPLTQEDLDKEIYIRNMGHSVTEAINRQLSHYSYHVGQIVFLGKMIKSNQWDSLSIKKGDSANYNNAKFAKPKRKEHFTEDL